ncbi:MAG: homocysteine S-methyltransferase family protein [Bacteroidota bacterium]
MKILDLYSERKKPLVLNGAMGSLLQQKGFIEDDEFWSARALLDNEEVVYNIHFEYINAGADIITTNTFRTNPEAVKRSSLNITSAELVKNAVRIAKNAIDKDLCVLAGSNAPAEDCYSKARILSSKELEYNHKNHINLLLENGTDVIWNETFSHFDEIELVCSICSEQNIEFTINLYLDNNLKLLNGESLSSAIKLISEYSPTAIGVNCVSPNVFSRIRSEISEQKYWGYYLNCGVENSKSNNIITDVNPNEYSIIVKESFNKNLLYIGSCCGSYFAHTKIIRETVDEFYPN